jgi:uncharacterized protein DUF6544
MAHATFGPAAVAGLDEPVRRFLTHAIGEGAALDQRVRLTMTGRIRVGRWLAFAADQVIGRDSFRWRARVAGGLLTVTDAFDGDAGAIEARLFGRRRLFAAHDEDVTRSAAGRCALEAVTFAPACLLPRRGVAWRAESDAVIVATWQVGPERPEVRVRIDERGAMRSVSAPRWGRTAHGAHGYVPCGGEIVAERSFGDHVLPSRIVVGWWFQTPRYEPFFVAEVHARR